MSKRKGRYTLKTFDETLDKWLKCPRCGGRTILFRHRALNWLCRKCGCIFAVDFDKKLVTPEVPQAVGTQAELDFGTRKG